jgi:ribosomal subunit interface protein
MQVPLQITFRNMESSDALEERIRQRAAELEQFYDRITSCHVMVEAQHRQHRQGHLFHVRIVLAVPGAEIVVGRDPAAHHAHEDAHVAVRDAFDAARRQLADHARRFRGQVKIHAEPGVAKVASLMAEDDYGFLLTPDGEEIYFHRNSVPNDGFDRLEVGAEVRFTVHPGEGDKGPQASTVVPLGQ